MPDDGVVPRLEESMDRFPILIASVWTCGVLFGGGCATTGSAHPGPEEESIVRLNAAGPSRDKGASSAEKVASRIDADIDQFLAQRAGAGRSPARESSADRDGAGSERAEADHPSPAAPRSVQFNDPSPSRTRAPAVRSESAPKPLKENTLASPERDLAPPPQETAAPAAPLADGSDEADARLDLLLVRLRQELMARSERSTQPLRETLAMAMLTIIDPAQRVQPEAFRALSTREREQLAALQEFFASIGTRLDGTNDAEQVLRESVEGLRKALNPEPAFELRNAALCWEVKGFADIRPFRTNSFLALREDSVILYVEMTGFTSELDKSGQWVTAISQQVEIYNSADNVPVWSTEWQRVEDKVSVKRSDFHTIMPFTLEKALSVGRYHLKIRARDEHTRAEAETSLTFDMVADAKKAAKVGE